MNPINPINPHPVPPSADALLPAAPSLDSFEKLIDQITSEKLSHNGPSPAAIAAQQNLEEYRHKLAVLTGMLEQAQAAMMSGPDKNSGPSPINEQKYFLLKSKLSQVGLPDGANNII